MIVLIPVTVYIGLDREPLGSCIGRPARQVGGDHSATWVDEQVKPGPLGRLARPLLRPGGEVANSASVGSGQRFMFAAKTVAHIVHGTGDADQMIGSKQDRQREREQDRVNGRDPEREAAKKPAHGSVRSI